MHLDEYLETARARLQRVRPEDLQSALDSGATVVDIRPNADRERFGTMPNAVVIERNVLLWRISPTSETRLDEIDPTKPVVVVCNDGYASSIAAMELQDVGVPDATDLAGGFNAWKAAQG